MTNKIKVICIVGCGRSGSTVLDTVLANHPSIEGVGELACAPRVLTNFLEYCACGEVAGRCEFWCKVQATWASLWPRMPRLENWAALQNRFERPTCLLKLFYEKSHKSQAFKTYLEGVETLYKAISLVSSNDIVVDSSKNPVRAIALSQAKNLDLKVIHLVRDCRGVMWSYGKTFSRDPRKGIQRNIEPNSAWRTAFDWRLTNRFAEIASASTSTDNRLFLRYEDFVTRPRLALEQIEQVVGIDLYRVSDALESDKKLSVGHAIAGNRVRMDRELRLELDSAWKNHLTRTQRFAFRLIAAGMSRRYGYIG